MAVSPQFCVGNRAAGDGKVNEVSDVQHRAPLECRKPKVFPGNPTHPSFSRWEEQEAKTKPPANQRRQVFHSSQRRTVLLEESLFQRIQKF